MYRQNIFVRVVIVERECTVDQRVGWGGVHGSGQVAPGSGGRRKAGAGEGGG